MLDHEINQRLQALTDKLHLLVEEKKGNLLDPGVVQVSQEMDMLIVSIQKSQLKVPKSVR